MNRRELLTGLAASLAAAKIPLAPVVEAYSQSPATSAAVLIEWLERVHQEIINKMCNPPYILFMDGSMEQVSLEADQRALQCVNITLKDLYAKEPRP